MTEYRSRICACCRDTLVLWPNGHYMNARPRCDDCRRYCLSHLWTAYSITRNECRKTSSPALRGSSQ